MLKTGAMLLDGLLNICALNRFLLKRSYDMIRREVGCIAPTQITSEEKPDTNSPNLSKGN